MAGIFSDANGGILGGADPLTLGLLSAAFKGMDASGPSVGVPVSLGQVIGRAGQAGVGTYASALEGQRKAAQTQAFIELEKQKVASEAEKLRQALQQDQMRQEILRRYGIIGGGNQPSAPSGPVGVSDATAAGLGAPWAASSNIQQPQATQGPAGGVAALLRDPNAVMALKLAGVGDVTDLFKHVNTPESHAPGSFVVPRDGRPAYGVPNNEGVISTPDGVRMAPGAQGVQATLNMIKQGAQAAYPTTPVTIPGTGNTPPRFTTPYAIATQNGAPDILGINGGPPVPQGLGGPAPAPAPIPVAPPAPVTSGGAPSVPPAGVLRMQPTETLEKMLAQTIEDAIAYPTKAATEIKPTFDAVKAELERKGVKVNVQFPGEKSSSVLAAGPSPAQVSEDKAKGASVEKKYTLDAERVAGLEQKMPSLYSTVRRLDRLEALTKDDKTFSSAGAELKTQMGSIAQAFGLHVNTAKTANSEEYLAHISELLKDRLASKDYGSGSGVSNLDLLTASKPLPELVKTPAGRMQIIQALKADTQRAITDAQSAQDYFEKNNSLRGFRYPSETATTQNTGGLPKTPASKIKFMGFE